MNKSGANRPMRAVRIANFHFMRSVLSLNELTRLQIVGNWLMNKVGNNLKFSWTKVG